MYMHVHVTYLRIMMRKYFAITVDDFSLLGGGYRLLFVFGGEDIFIIGICGDCL